MNVTPLVILQNPNDNRKCRNNRQVLPMCLSEMIVSQCLLIVQSLFALGNAAPDDDDGDDDDDVRKYSLGYDDVHADDVS